jgi:hypothetical protein
MYVHVSEEVTCRAGWIWLSKCFSILSSQSIRQVSSSRWGSIDSKGNARVRRMPGEGREKTCRNEEVQNGREMSSDTFTSETELIETVTHPPNSSTYYVSLLQFRSCYCLAPFEMWRTPLIQLGVNSVGGNKAGVISIRVLVDDSRVRLHLSRVNVFVSAGRTCICWRGLSADSPNFTARHGNCTPD